MQDLPSLAQPAIRRIRPDDAEAWRSVRLRALQEAPTAFGSTYEETGRRVPEEWTTRAAASAAGAESAIFLADDGRDPIGLVGGYRPTEAGADPRTRELISMWVAPQWRGTRLAARLVTSVLDWSAVHDAERVDLWVTETNERAISLYRRQAFAPTGARQPHPSNPALAEIEMTRPLDGYVALRRIRPHESAVWRATRLAALQDTPDAFGPTFEDSAALPPTIWSDRVAAAATGDHLAVFAAVDRHDRWLGLAGAGTPDGDPATRHLGSVWVSPAARGAGLLRRLLDAVTDWSVSVGATRIALDVTETNERAIAIYAQYGYRASGHRQPLRPGSDLDEIEMTMELYAPKE
ncbi:MAG: GNAT family N-acetyltransferase [Chloroflexi bacterium]|nr:GNAT family N-acetyltransferase [Chloroflexota bacterium]MDA1147337.1 GNAT family N-acetyltransferase [Chloroflexota bacterium]